MNTQPEATGTTCKLRKKPSPYIGVTGVTTPKEAIAIKEVFDKHCALSSEYRLHIGVMTNAIMLKEVADAIVRNCPQANRIADIFSGCSASTMNCVHLTSEDINLFGGDWHAYKAAIRAGLPYINALQLDIVNPKPNDVRNARNSSLADLELILQIGGELLTELAGEAKKLADYLRLNDYIANYEPNIHHVLLDPSRGKGKTLDPEVMFKLVEALMIVYPNLGFTVAGGLSAETADLIDPLVDICPYLSVDAEARLHVGGSTRNPLDLDAACRYVEVMAKKLTRNRR